MWLKFVDCTLKFDNSVAVASESFYSALQTLSPGGNIIQDQSAIKKNAWKIFVEKVAQRHDA